MNAQPSTLKPFKDTITSLLNLDTEAELQQYVDKMDHCLDTLQTQGQALEEEVILNAWSYGKETMNVEEGVEGMLIGLEWFFNALASGEGIDTARLKDSLTAEEQCPMLKVGVEEFIAQVQADSEGKWARLSERFVADNKSFQEYIEGSIKKREVA